MKLFPSIILAIFVGLGAIGMLVIATYTSLNQAKVGEVLVWGSLPSETMRPVFQSLKSIKGGGFEGVTYQSMSAETLVPELIAAIAAGRGPDLVFLSAEYLFSERDKLIVIPYSSLSRRDFQDTFVEAGEVFLSDEGILGLPILIDPLIMYWNRSLFSAAGIAEPPRFWDDVTTLAPRLSSFGDSGTITKSAVSFGAWSNVEYAKPILLTLLRQLGDPVIAAQDGRYSATLGDRSSPSGVSSDSALRFYTDFADPVKPVYSWNRSQPNSRDAFLGGTLAIYFGRASELYGIRQANPNLNFDVASVPSVRGAGSAVEAEVIGVSIPRGSRNPNGAFLVAQTLASSEIQSIFEGTLHVPSVRRQAFSNSSADPFSSVFKDATLTSFVFLDPDPGATEAVFERMVEHVTSGNLSVSEAIAGASRELDALVRVQ